MVNKNEMKGYRRFGISGYLMENHINKKIENYTDIGLDRGLQRHFANVMAMAHPTYTPAQACIF